MNAAAAGGRGGSRDQDQPQVASCIRHVTDDRDEAEQVVTQLYLPNRLDLPINAPLRMELTGLRLGALTVSRLAYGRRVPPFLQNNVNVPLSGIEERDQPAGRDGSRRGSHLLSRSTRRA